MEKLPTSKKKNTEFLALAAEYEGIIIVSQDGEIEQPTLKELHNRLKKGLVPILCNGPEIAQKLGIDPFRCLDILELFAFVYPTSFILPTIRGVAEGLQLAQPNSIERQSETILHATHLLLKRLEKEINSSLLQMLVVMREGGWLWAEIALTNFKKTPKLKWESPINSFQTWKKLNDWQEPSSKSRPEDYPVSKKEALIRLSEMVGIGNNSRFQQREYTKFCTKAFLPQKKKYEPTVIFAEAGTGIGKTLGYIAPASVWAEKNKKSVWISTFTRNLQAQLNTELDFLHPIDEKKNERIVTRKGRENYICLLNFEEAIKTITTTKTNKASSLGIIARWVSKTNDGDIIGGDFPSWLHDLIGHKLVSDLTDRRGECIYSKCNHYKKCFIERSVKRSKKADIVIANHALVMAHAEFRKEKNEKSTRYIFDEGHHLFDVADSTFCYNLTGRVANELREWLIGVNHTAIPRSRGLKKRLEGLITDNEKDKYILRDILTVARQLPSSSWHQRVSEKRPLGITESFLAQVFQHTYFQNPDKSFEYDLEAHTSQLTPELLNTSYKLQITLEKLSQLLLQLTQSLTKKLKTEVDSQNRTRIEALIRHINQNGINQINNWQSMLSDLETSSSEKFIDWFSVKRFSGHDYDVGFHRNWVNPMEPFVNTVIKPAHGILITSATLIDDTNSSKNSMNRLGTEYLNSAPVYNSQLSPFNYAKNTKIIIITDVNRYNLTDVASAYQKLFLASKGGALGLFTAITRLRSVFHQISKPLGLAGLSVLAQHVSTMNTGTLVNIFRSEKNSCLLGTDAVRDGVNVPGQSLRLIVFDRVPWPRASILHKSRRGHFGGMSYDETLTRLKLKQAYGRLIRKATDKGIFIMLDKGLPSRLMSGFPEGVNIERVKLASAISIIEIFFRENQ